MRRVLNQAANAAVKHKGSIFEIVYRRLVARLSHNKPIEIFLSLRFLGRNAGELSHRFSLAARDLQP